MKRFEGKVALITGAASGIGRAAVERLAQEGASIACVDVNEKVQEAAAKAEALGAQAIALVCDISDEAQVEKTIAAAVARFDRLDVLANVAGILRADNTHEARVEDFERILKVNLTGTFTMCKHAIPHLLKARGNIVNVASNAALGKHPYMAAYAASKGGILSLTKVLAFEYAKQRLRANAVCPGGITTPMHAQFSMPKGGDPDLLRSALPVTGRYAKPEEVASVIAFLASDDAKYITGEEIRVDGGAL